MKKISKFLSIILAILMVISIIPITASAEENSVYDYTVISEEEKTCRLNGDDGISRTDSDVLEIPSEVDGYKVVELADYFTYYSSTNKIIVPDSVERIGKAFDGDGVLYLVLGAGVSDFNAKNFGNMDNLKEFIVSEDNPYICSVDGVVFTKDMKTLLRFPTNSTNGSMYEIPDGVEVIGERAFEQGWNLTTVTIPDSVTAIESRAFSICSKLYRLYVGKGIQTIGEYAFSNCPKLADVICSFPETKLDEISISTKGNANLLNAHFQFDDTDHECEYYVSEVVPPSCSYDGYTLYICSICGSEYEDDYVPATEEHNIEVVGKTDPTCTEKGYTTYKCVLCNGSYADDYVDKLGHDFEEIATSPDTSECVKNYECTRCGETKTSNGHEKVTIPAKLPTTTEAGTTRDERCSNCGLVYLEGQIIPALNENSFANLQGDNLIGVLDKEARTLTIYGTGTIEKEHNFTATYDKELGMTVGYTSYVDDVIIKEGVTGIGDDAFSGQPFDTYIIADSVKTIGDSAFFESFAKKIIIGDGVETIGPHAFRNCLYLKELEIGKSVKTIGNLALLNCDVLETITVDSENPYFSSDEFGVMFNKDKTTLILCPQATKMTSYTIPDTVTTIKEDAFVECGEGLKSITIPKSVTVIEDDAITTSGSMFHPASLDIYYLGIEEEWNLINDGNGVETDRYTTVHFGENVHEAHHSETIVTPPTCTAQGYTTFTCDCGFTYAEDYVNPTGHTDNDSDKYCDSCYEYIGIDTGVFGNKFVWTFDDVTGTLTISGSGAMSHYGTNAPFKAYKDDIKVVIINEGITEISDYAFYSYGSITDVIIHNGVTKIGFSSFENCYQLTTVTIPDSITHIDNYAFYSCYKLRDVKYSGSIEQWREITIDTYNQPLLNARKHYNTTETHKIEYQLTVINPTCMEQGYTTYTCVCGDTYVDDYVDVLGHIDNDNNNCCDKCSKYILPTSGSWGNNVTWTFDESTGTLTFSGTGEMESFVASYGVPWNGHIDSIENVVISEGVTTITPSAFYNNKNIKNVSIADSVTDIGDEAFYNCTDLTNVVIGDGVTTIGDWAFYNCKGLTDVVIGKGVTVIGDYAFDDCSNLKTVTIYNAVEEICRYAFNGCSKLTDVYYFGTEAEWNAISKGYTLGGIIVCGTGLENATIHFLGEETHECSYNAVVTAPTCTEQGYTTYTCECGDSYVDDYIDAIGHNYSSEITTPATHTSTGVMTYTCTCGNTYTEAIEKLEKHNHEAVVTVPTCTEQGYTTYICECGDSYVDDYVNATGHSHTSEVTTPATHTETGIMTYTCVCGDTYTEVIAKLEKHNYEAVVTPPTCKEQGYTTYTCECGDTHVADYVDALGHTEEIIPSVAPTCTETGLTEGVKCSVCGDTLTEQNELPANGHTPAKAVEENYVAPTCEEQGSKDVVVYCSVCDEEISRETESLEATGHIDNDGDGYCDADNELLDPSVECECNCHKDDITNFFFKLILFFQRLFGSNKTCECGVAHY